MSWDIRGHPGMSQTWRQCQVPESQVQDVLGYPGTSRDVPDLEAVSGPRVPGPRCPGISGDIPGCPRPGGSVRSQSPRSKMSWDIRGHPGMSQTWRQCQVPESQVQDVLGYLGTSRDVPDLEAVLGPRVPGPRCPGISGDILGCPRPGGSVRSQSPRSKMSRDIRGHPGMSQTWRQCQVPESQVQDVQGYLGTSRDVPDLEAVLGPRVPGPRCPGISGDIPGCPRPGGSVRSQSPRSKMSWDIRGHPGMSQTWRQCQVPESQVQDVLGYPGTSRDVPDLEAVSGPRVPGPRCPGISGDIPGCPRPGGSVRSQSPRSKMSWDIWGHPGMSQTWRQC